MLVSIRTYIQVELFYYDQLGEPREEIHLTVDLAPRAPPPPPPSAVPRGAKDDDGTEPVPPLDLVVRTRWTGAAVDWNGHEHIL